MITIQWTKNGIDNFQQIDFVTAKWSGTENQAARTLEFATAWNPYDKAFPNIDISLGDKVKLYDGKTLLFLGIITSREKTAAIGTATYSAYDYMHYLLRSTVTRIFKSTTPKKATVSLCKQVGVKTGKMENPNVRIASAVYKDKSIYDIIIALYRKAYKKKGIKYMPTMKGDKFTIIEKGQSSEVTLDQTKDITGASYHDTTDNMVNHVIIYSDKNQKAGQVQKKTLKRKYGTYMQAYTKKKDENAKTAAKAMLVGITKEASVEALGNVKCTAGKSVQIKDSATGIKGKFYISSDTHTFQNGVHTMSLELSWTNTMEEGADEEKKS